MKRPISKVALTRPDADRIAVSVLEHDEAFEDEETLPPLVNRGLFRWDPDPWESQVDVIQPYYFWMYESHDPMGDPVYIAVGFVPKGGADAWAPDLPRGVEVSLWKDEGQEGGREMYANTRPARAKDLRQEGLTDIHVLAVMGSAG